MSLVFSLCAQKNDYIWVLGHNGGTTIDFNNSPPNIFFADRQPVMHLDNASIADSLGNLLFYTNGCDIFNKENQVMDGGDEINPGSVHNEYCSGSFSAYIGSRGAIALPFHDEKYYLFHEGAVLFLNQPQIDGFFNKLYYSVIDMTANNNGLGKVVEKNNLILQDTFHAGDLAAVRHTNNNDWWIISPKRYSDKYFKVLFASDGSMAVSEQVIGDSTFIGSDAGGQALFSPNGQLYVRYNPQSDIMIFDFDRSTGEMSNYRHIEIPGDSAFVGGAAISPNSRFLYISSETKFYQYDLQSSDIAASQVLLGEYDGYVSPFATTFYNCQLGPDCKIYCNCYNSCDVFHVVNYPDEPGLACDFVQHGVQLASSNALSLPNFPNYRLGTGQPPCMPTATEEVAVKKVLPFSLSPNPASDWAFLQTKDEASFEGKLQIFDVSGKLQLDESMVTGIGQPFLLDLTRFNAGFYSYKILRDGKLVCSDKLIIVK